MPLFSSIKDGSFFSDVKGGSKFSDMKALGSLSSNVNKVTNFVNRVNQSSGQSQNQSQQQQQQQQLLQQQLLQQQQQLYCPPLNLQQPYYQQPYQAQPCYNQQPTTPAYSPGIAASTWVPASSLALPTASVPDSTQQQDNNPYGDPSQAGWTSTPSCYYPDPSSTTLPNDYAGMATATQANIDLDQSATADQGATSAIDQSNGLVGDLNDNLYGSMAADQGCTLVDDVNEDNDDAADVGYDYSDGV